MAIKFARNVEPVRAGKNVWVKWGGREEDTVIAVHKGATPPDDDWMWGPLVNPDRINHDCYRPYAGNSEWVKEANRVMTDEANRNFRNGR